MAVFFLFLLALSAGCLSTLFWIPEEDMGRGYFQMNALVVLGLLALAAAVLALHPFAPFGGRVALGWVLVGGALGAAFLYHAGVWRRAWARARWAAGAATLLTAGALVTAGLELAADRVPLPHREPLLGSGLVASAALLGWSLITMLLGHWYLVAPRLTFRHLTVFCRVLVGAVGARLALVAVTLALAARAPALADPHPWPLLTGLAGEGMFLWFRILWGLAIPLALALMSLHCAKRRANQSATGILYVVVVGTLIGEITGLYITLSTGLPV